MSNDHYVPQHYLRAWAHDGTEKKLFAYKLIEQQSKVHFKKDASIKKSSSQDDLYRISDGENYAEFETTVMTPAVDTPGSEVIKKTRTSGLSSLTAEEKAKLACYIVILEGRHPDTIKKMDISEEDIHRIFRGIEAQGGVSREAIHDVESLMLKMQSSLGTAAAGMFAGWGHGREAQALLNKEWIEVTRSDTRGFICSNYPVGSFNDYTDANAAITFPLSPTTALWCVPSEVKMQLDRLDSHGRETTMIHACKMIDIFTLGKATEAYSLIADRDPFIQRHLGWMRRKAREGWGAYLKMAMEDPGHDPLAREQAASHS